MLCSVFRHYHVHVLHTHESFFFKVFSIQGWLNPQMWTQGTNPGIEDKSFAKRRQLLQYPLHCCDQIPDHKQWREQVDFIWLTLPGHSLPLRAAGARTQRQASWLFHTASTLTGKRQPRKSSSNHVRYDSFLIQPGATFPGNDAAHSGVGLPASINKKDNPPCRHAHETIMVCIVC